MSDIVERLREVEAADEIERLQCEVGAWVSVICGLCPDRETDKCHLCWKGKKRKKHEWISVKDRFPEDITDDVVVRIEKREPGKYSWWYGVGCYSKASRTWLLYKGSEMEHGEIITHWTPLPEQPKEEE